MRAEDVLRLQEQLYGRWCNSDGIPRGYIGYQTWVAAGCPPDWIVRYGGAWVDSEELRGDGDELDS